MGAPSLSGWSTVNMHITSVVAVRPASYYNLEIDLSKLPASFWNTVKTAGADIRIMSEPARAQIDLWIKSFTNNGNGTGTGLVRVRVPWVPPTGYIIFWVFSGNASATTISDATKVITRLPEPHEVGVEIGRWYFNDGDNSGSGGAANRVWDYAHTFGNPLTIFGTAGTNFTWNSSGSPGIGGSGTGFNEKCLTLTSGSGYVYSDLNFGLKLNKPGFSQYMWYKTNNTSNGMLWTLQDNDAAHINWIGFAFNFNYLSWYDANAGFTLSDQTASRATGVWHLAVVTWTPSGAAIWVDGVKQSSTGRKAYGNTGMANKAFNYKSMCFNIDVRAATPALPAPYQGSAALATYASGVTGGTINSTALTLGPCGIRQSSMTDEEIVGMWNMDNPIQYRARHKLINRGMFFQPYAGGREVNSNQEAKLGYDATDPDGPFVMMHLSGFATGSYSLKKTNDPLGEWKNYDIVIGGPANFLPGFNFLHEGFFIDPNTAAWDVTFWQGANGDIYLAESTDHGKTWTQVSGAAAPRTMASMR